MKALSLYTSALASAFIFGCSSSSEQASTSQNISSLTSSSLASSSVSSTFSHSSSSQALTQILRMQKLQIDYGNDGSIDVSDEKNYNAQGDLIADKSYSNTISFYDVTYTNSYDDAGRLFLQNGVDTKGRSTIVIEYNDNNETHTKSYDYSSDTEITYYSYNTNHQVESMRIVKNGSEILRLQNSYDDTTLTQTDVYKEQSFSHSLYFLPKTTQSDTTLTTQNYQIIYDDGESNTTASYVATFKDESEVRISEDYESDGIIDNTMIINYKRYTHPKNNGVEFVDFIRVYSSII